MDVVLGLNSSRIGSYCRSLLRLVLSKRDEQSIVVIRHLFASTSWLTDGRGPVLVKITSSEADGSARNAVGWRTSAAIRATTSLISSACKSRSAMDTSPEVTPRQWRQRGDRFNTSSMSFTMSRTIVLTISPDWMLIGTLPSHEPIKLHGMSAHHIGAQSRAWTGGTFLSGTTSEEGRNSPQSR